MKEHPLIEALKETRLTRREFLKLLFLMLGGIIFFNKEVLNFLEWLNYFIYESAKKVIKKENLQFKELGINSPFIYLKSEEWEKYVGLLKKLKEMFKIEKFRIRLFISDDFEKNLGEYNQEVLKSILNFYNFLKKNNIDFILEIDLIDCYSIGNSLKPNLVYGTSPITSPYNLTKDLKGYYQFFVNDELRKKFISRARTILSFLKQYFENEELIISIANEPEPPVENLEEKRKILTEWYQFVLDNIKDLLSEKWKLVAGVKNPDFLSQDIYNQGIIPTLHLYPFEFSPSTLESWLKKYPNIYIQELGTPYKILNLPNPFEKQIMESLMEAVKNNPVSLWKLDFYEDGFQIPFLDN